MTCFVLLRNGDSSPSTTSPLRVQPCFCRAPPFSPCGQLASLLSVSATSVSITSFFFQFASLYHASLLLNPSSCPASLPLFLFQFQFQFLYFPALLCFSLLCFFMLLCYLTSVFISLSIYLTPVM